MKIDILRITDGKTKKATDSVAEEGTLTIYLEDKEFISILCSPKDIKELVIGFLFSSGVINLFSDIKKIWVNEKNLTVGVELRNPKNVSFRMVHTSGCGKGMVFEMPSISSGKINPGVKITAQKILCLMNEFQNMSSEFKKTGGVHSAGFSNGKKIVFFNEDIGRHNAVDKITGKALIKNTALKKMVLFTSGRVSSEIVQKVLRASVYIIVSRSAPTLEAVKLCKEKNITLIGFARGKRMNVYSSENRIM